VRHRNVVDVFAFGQLAARGEPLTAALLEDDEDAPAVAGGLQIPDDLEVLPASSLSVVMLPLADARTPEWLELTGAAAGAAPGDTAGAGTPAPGLFVVAITQVVRR
jgi:hypothetical protein